ncbi:uncharacterized protein LOC115921736 [Strongylocentrotus purpuratus]|uniref:5'-3' DNA helicase ZGRF1-like N-terminal domain-containing protein n=1 Tax=Strongylocentrotus purpuratus TaxID=7668 RepID=A0A7M7SW27_STRPU|nr:uncharacterized protein LOC115921736 [Strongylocentrotus purpuratus]
MAGREFVVLYTHQKRKKAKVWQDGVLKINDQGTKADLIGAGNKRLDQVHIKANQAAIGEVLESEKYLITIEESVSSDKPNPEAVKNEKASVNQPDHRPHTQALRRQPLKRKRMGFVPPRQVNKRPSPEKENPLQTQEIQQLATSSGFESPRSSLFSTPCTKTEVSSPQGPNILNLYGRSTVKAAQSTTHHAASELQQPTRNNTGYDPQQLKDDFQPESQEWNEGYLDDRTLPSHNTANSFSPHPESTSKTVMGVDPCELEVRSQPEKDFDMRGTLDDREGGSDLSRTDAPVMNKSSFSSDPSSTNQDLWRTSSEQDCTSYRKHTDLSASSVMPGTNPDSVEARLSEETKGHTGNAPGAKRSTSRILALLGKGKKPFQPPLKQKISQGGVTDTVLHSSIGHMKDTSSPTTIRPQAPVNVYQSNYQASVISSEPVVLEKDVFDDHLSYNTESHPPDSLPIHTSREFDAGHMRRTAASMRTSQHHSIPSENDLVRLKATSGQAAEGGHREAAVCDESRVSQESPAPRQNQHMKHCLNKRTGMLKGTLSLHA